MQRLASLRRSLYAAAVLVTLVSTGSRVRADTYAMTSPVYIVRISNGDGQEGIYIDVDKETSANCGTKKRLFIDKSVAQLREMLSMALLAFAQSRPIEVHYLTDSCDLTDGSGVKLRAIALILGH